jgi:dihydropteroate synthase
LPTRELCGGPIRTIGPRTYDFSRDIAIMAIINRTRDSFHDRGRHFSLSSALEAITRAVELGADWVDIGAVPFSPHAHNVEAREERTLLLPAIRHAVELGVVVSVDTFRAEVAEAAVEAGAHAINDTSGLRDPGMADVVARTDAFLVITHSLAPPRTLVRSPRYRDVTEQVRGFLADRVEAARTEGVAAERLLIDPGHDLHKNTLHSLELTRRLDTVATLPYPLLVSVSNKDFVHEVTGSEPAALTAGTVASLVVCMGAGAQVLRVHDVASARAAAAMISAIEGRSLPRRLDHNMG